MSRRDRLRAYVEASQGEPVIGKDDCGPWVANWISQETGIQIEFPAYSERVDGYAMAAKAGGFVKFVAPLMSDFYTTVAPALGDVGIIKLSDRETAVIFGTDGIALLRGERRGVLPLRPSKILRAWALDAAE